MKNEPNIDIIHNAMEGSNDNLCITSDIINCDRANNDRLDTFSNAAEDIKLYKESDRKYNDNNVNIFRYKFTQIFMDELYKFSKVHQYDHRHDFKEAWKIWVEENNDLVDSEVRRLTNLGYDGDIIDKMFKSARYYFRKKSSEKKEPQKRRDYIGVNKEFLDIMDQHIHSNMNKPSEGFDDFCKINIEVLKEEVNRLCKCGLTDPVEMKNKIKKTYKNRYFILVNK